MKTREWYATVQNQYGLGIGSAFGSTRKAAIKAAMRAAAEKLRTANPNWKWKAAKRSCQPYVRPV